MRLTEWGGQVGSAAQRAYGCNNAESTVPTLASARKLQRGRGKTR